MVNWSHWHTEPLLVGGILFVCWLYSILVGPLRDRIKRIAPFPKTEVCYFALGMVSFYLAVGSPLDALGEGFLFSAHMFQHNILMYLSPLFFVLGVPGWLVDRAARKSVLFRKVFRFLVHPVVSGTAFTLSFSIWHFPYLFELALRSKFFHSLEHLTMFISSILMWWNIASRSKIFPPLQWGVQILYFFALMVAQTPVFGILTFAKNVLYPTYADAARIFPSLDPTGDQMLGGFIMKFTNMVASLAVIGAAFYKWANRSRVSAGLKT